MDSPETLHLYFDYVDPASFLMEKQLRKSLRPGDISLVLVPFEIRPPPQPLMHHQDPDWSLHWQRMLEEAEPMGVDLKPPWIVPWSRKAHELSLHAKESSCHEEIHDAIFRAYFESGKDIGRVDVLVEVARSGGLDAMEARVVLDVDRFREAVEAERAEGLAAGVTEPSTLIWRGRSLRGYPGPRALEEFLASARDDES